MNKQDKIQFIEQTEKYIAELVGVVTVLKKELEALNKPTHPLLCRFELGQAYWFTVNVGDVVRCIWTNHKFDHTRLAHGNVWETCELAQRYGLLGEHAAFVMREIATYNDGWLPDWSKEYQPKYLPVYRHIEEGFRLEHYNSHQYGHNWLYLKDNKFKPSEEFKNHYLKMLGVEV